MTPAPVHLEFLRDCVQLTPAPGERVTRILGERLGAGDKFIFGPAKPTNRPGWERKGSGPRDTITALCDKMPQISPS